MTERAGSQRPRVVLVGPPAAGKTTVGRLLADRLSVPASAGRVGLNRDRPLLLGNPRQQLRALLDARLPLYREVAVAEVGTDDRSPDEVADAVLAAVTPAGAT